VHNEQSSQNMPALSVLDLIKKQYGNKGQEGGQIIIICAVEEKTDSYIHTPRTKQHAKLGGEIK